MQRKAALWILGAFYTFSTGGIEALVGLIPIHLNASVIPPRNMQAVSVAHFWRLGEQVLSFKAPAG